MTFGGVSVCVRRLCLAVRRRTYEAAFGDTLKGCASLSSGAALCGADTTDVDEQMLRLLVDVRTHFTAQKGVRGGIAALIVQEQTGEVVSWGFVRSLTQDSSRGGKQRAVADLHAEADAVTCAARNGRSCQGATLYCSSICCLNCFRLAAASGIQRVVTPPPPNEGFYSSERRRVRAIAKRHGITVHQDAVLPEHRQLSGPPSLPELSRAWGGCGADLWQCDPDSDDDSCQ